MQNLKNLQNLKYLDRNGLASILYWYYFSALLQTSINPEKGTGPATYSRNSSGSVIDFEGNLKLALSGGSRFTGSRRVRNSIDFNVYNWSTNVTIGITSSITDKDGGNKAFRLNANGSNSYIINTTGFAVGDTVRNTCWVKRVTGTGTVLMYNGGTSPLTTDITTIITSNWQRIDTGLGSVTGNTYMGFGINTSGDEIDICFPQSELVNGQLNQNPSEYISKGIIRRNLFTNTEFPNGLTDTPIRNGVSATTLAGYSGAIQFPALSGTTNYAYKSNYNTISGAAYTISAIIKMDDNSLPVHASTSVDATGDFLFVVGGTTAGQSNKTVENLGNNLYRCSAYFSSASSSSNNGVIQYLGNSQKGFKVTAYQIEFLSTKTIYQKVVDGSSNNFENYHGSCLDGVKYLNYQNGNTVSANIVIEATGSAISTTTMKGALIEPQSINSITYSEDLRNTADAGGSRPWSYVNTTLGYNSTTAVNGTVTACKITDTSSNTTHYHSHDIAVVTGTYYTLSCFTKAGEYSRFSMGYAGFAVTFDLSTVSVVNLPAGHTASIRLVSNGWYRCQINWQSTLTATTTARIYLNTNIGLSSQAFIGTGTSGVYIWGVQSGVNRYATSYIKTAGGTATRIVDILNYPKDNNIIASKGTLLLEFTPHHGPIVEDIYLWGSYVDASNYTALLHDGTNLVFRKRISGSNYNATIVNAFVNGTTYKIACSWGVRGVNIALDGTLGTPNADITACQLGTTMEIGSLNSVGQPTASIKGVKTWKEQFSNPYLTKLSLP